MADKQDKHAKQTAISGADLSDAITVIRGPSAAQLRQPFEKSLDEIARELQQGHADAVRTFEGEHRGRR
jgi:hypothetical protein